MTIARNRAIVISKLNFTPSNTALSTNLQSHIVKSARHKIEKKMNDTVTLFTKKQNCPSDNWCWDGVDFKRFMKRAILSWNIELLIIKWSMSNLFLKLF